MAMKPVLKSLDEVDESLRGEYAPNADGQFVLQLEDAGGLKIGNFDKVERTIGALRNEVKTLEGTLSSFNGATPSDVLELRTKVKTLEQLDPADTAKFESMKSQIVEKSNVEITKYRDLADTRKFQLEKYAVSNAATSAIAENRGIDKLLRPLVESATRVEVMESGEIQAYVVDEAGQPRVANAEGRRMTPNEYVSELREDETYGTAFLGTSQSGSGSRSTTETPATKVKVDFTSDPYAIGRNLEKLSSGEAEFAE